MNPRTHIESLIAGSRLAELLDIAASVHGHYCPGLAMGVLAAADAMRHLGTTSDGLEDLVAISETNNCFSDGIQVVTGCTFGNNGLIFRDLGKTAFTLAKRGGKAFRYVVRPTGRSLLRERYAEYTDAYEQVVKVRNRDQGMLSEYFRLGRLRAMAVLDIDPEALFDIAEAHARLPDYAPSLPSFTCRECGEEFMQGRSALTDEHICLTCSVQAYNELTGYGINTVKL